MTEPQMVQTDRPMEVLWDYMQRGYKAQAVRTDGRWYVCYGRTHEEVRTAVNACLED